MTAAIALLGVLVPASVALIGYLFKSQSDHRVDEETKQSQKRLDQDRDSERARLRLDAAMQAAALFGSSDSVPPNPASSASGLLALTELGRAELAVALLVDLWSIPARQPSQAERACPASGGTNGAASHGNDDEAVNQLPHGSVSNETAVLVINAALTTKDCHTGQLIAAELLCRNATRLNSCQSLHWPAAIDGRWIPELPTKAKLLIMEGLIDMTCKVDADENALRTLVVRLYGIWKGDSANPRVQGCVGTLIDAILPAASRLGYTEFMQAQEVVTLDELNEAAKSKSGNPDGYLEKLLTAKSKRLETWSNGCTTCNFETGALATAALPSTTS